MKINKSAIITIAVIILFLSYGIIIKSYTLGLNLSRSLPFSVFVIKKEVGDLKVGDYVAFRLKNNQRFGDSIIVKMVGGIAGDKLEVRKDKYFINGNYVGTAKNKSKDGDWVEKLKSGTIPKGHIFVFTLHKDSYDSKYKEVGYVAEDAVIGIAYPFF